MPKQRLDRVIPAEDGVLNIWELGSLAYRWARAPLALSPDELDRYRDLCDQANVDPTLLLYRFQQYWRDQSAPIVPELPPVESREELVNEV